MQRKKMGVFVDAGGALDSGDAHNSRSCSILGDSTYRAKQRESPIGAHLVSSRHGYTHHGNYAGQGMVLHYAGLSRTSDSGAVAEVTMAQFSGGRTIGTMDYTDSNHSSGEIVGRARSRIGENRYHVLKNNCEHFCNWCISGRSSSPQVERSLTTLLLAQAVMSIGTHRFPRLLESLRSMVLRGRVAALGLAAYRRVAAG